MDAPSHGRLVRTWPPPVPASIAHHDTGEHQHDSRPQGVRGDPTKRRKPVRFRQIARIRNELIDVVNDRDDDNR
jgi:hypothetical protein